LKYHRQDYEALRDEIIDALTSEGKPPC
jgi:hypothetical protein